MGDVGSTRDRREAVGREGGHRSGLLTVMDSGGRRRPAVGRTDGHRQWRLSRGGSLDWGGTRQHGGEAGGVSEAIGDSELLAVLDGGGGRSFSVM
jgi:hypothetical protein